MPELTRPDAIVSYEVLGEGPPLLMIAGIASDRASWGPLVPYLQTKFQLILIDNRGAGRTACAPEAVTVDAMIADCIALLDHLGIGQADILGHSLGGMIGFRIARHRSERVRRLIGLATGITGSYKTQALLEDMAALNGVGVPQDLWFRLLYQWLFATRFFNDRSAVAAAVEGSLAYAFIQPPEQFALQVAASRALKPFDAATLGVPTLALMGEEDIMIPEKVVRASLKGHPDVRFKTVAGAGHSVHWDAPGATAREIADFLLG